jgi:hypothetical protein
MRMGLPVAMLVLCNRANNNSTSKLKLLVILYCTLELPQL